MKRIAFILFALLSAAGVSAAGRGVAAVARPAGDGVFSAAEPVDLTVDLRADKPCEGTVTLTVATDFGEEFCTLAESYALEADGALTLHFRPEIDRAGFYRARVTCDGETVREFNFGYDPEHIVSAPDAKKDLRKFWYKALRELAAVDPEYRLTRLDERCTARRETYLVEMKSLGGETIRGYWVVPTAEGVYPVSVMYMGYDSEPWIPDADARDDRCEFVLSHRGQGLNKPENKYGDWIVSGLASPETYYYRGAYMDAVRAIDFVYAQPKTDRRNIFVEGGSQGGALTLAAAALDHRINAAMPFVPFMSDFPDYVNLAGWPAAPLRAAAKAEGISEERMLEVLSYFDVKNLAPWIECPVLMGFGLQDSVCPPHTNFAGYNQIRTPKRWIVYTDRGHDVHNESGWWAERDRFAEENMKR